MTNHLPPIHPGEVLSEEFLKPFGLTASGLAARLGVPANRISMIVNGSRDISPETAILFGEAFGTTARFWLNLQAQHDLEIARDKLTDEAIGRAREVHRTLEPA